jgi:hypothetical protein
VGKLKFDFQVPDKYDRQTISQIVRAICNQVNQLSEGTITARYQAQSAIPSGTAVSYAQGDIIWDTSPSVLGSVAPGVASQYVRLGWVCTAPGSPGTLKEIRVLIGS